MPDTKQWYQKQLSNPKWQRRRLEILQRDDWTCQKCGDKETELHVHHTEYVSGKSPEENPDEFLITLCAHCHEIIEDLGSAIDINNVHIVKSAGWTGECMIIYISMPDRFIIKIYHGDDQLSFNFNERELLKLSEAIQNHTIKNG